MSTRPVVQRRPYGVACLSCRRAKMRCVLPVTPGEHRCERCARLQRDCMFESHRRGLWRRDQGGTENNSPTTAAAAARESMSLTTTDFASNLAAHISSHNEPGSVFAEQEKRWAPSQSGSPRDPPTSSTSSSSKPDSRNFAPASFVNDEEDAGELSLNLALDPERRALDGVNTNSNKSVGSSQDRDTAWQESDPIFGKLASLPSAQFLFEGFMKHFNSIVGFLDPDLYTFSYTREASSLLFTSVLSIAATVFRPELHRSLKEHQENLLGKALLACDARIETVWALCLLYFWKDVNDRRGYNFIGYGLQLAKSAEWNKMIPGKASGRRPLELDTQVRRKRDIDRVWLLLGSLDRTSSMLTNRPFSCPRILDSCASREWVGRDPKCSYVWGEARHVSHYEMSTICWDVYDLIMNTQNRHDYLPENPALTSKYDLRAFQRLMQRFNDDMDEWREYWARFMAKLPHEHPGLLPSQVHLYWAYMKLHFNSILLHRMLAKNDDITDPSISSIFYICYSSSLAVLKEATEQARMDIFYYLWDTAHLMVAYSAMMFLKLRNLACESPEASADNPTEILSQLFTAYNNAAQSISQRPEQCVVDGEKTAVMNGLEAQARLLRSILTTIEARFFEPQPNESEPSDIAMGVGSNSINNNQPSPIWTQISVGSSQSGSSALGMPTIAAVESLETLPLGAASMDHLIDNMDISLDTSFMDSRFVDAGLLFWDEPGIFPEQR